MQWMVKHGDILDEPADVLICSANPFLTLSGGVGGALQLRYGYHLGEELNAYLKGHDKKYVSQGTVVVTRPKGTPYKMILHAVAVDGMYESTPGIVAQVVERSLMIAAEEEAASVALTALATGYGRLSPSSFGEGISTLMPKQFAPINNVAIVVRQAGEVDEIRQSLRR